VALSPRCYDWCGSPLPVPPGKSTYRIKGEFYRHLGATITRVDGKSGGALLKAFARDGLTQFQRQPFVSSLLYDNLPLPRMVMCIAEVMGKDIVELTTKMGRTAGEAQMKGVYQQFLTEMNVKSFGTELKKLLSFFYDYGTVEVTYGADGKSMRLVRGGVPLAVIEWWCLVSVPFLQVPLEAHGAKGLDTKWKVDVTDAAATVPLGRATWDLKWS
jgi:hypothetical protein